MICVNSISLSGLGCNIYWLLSGKESPEAHADQSNQIEKLQNRIVFLEMENRHLQTERDQHLMKIGELMYRLNEKITEPSENHRIAGRDIITEGDSIQ